MSSIGLEHDISADKVQRGANGAENLYRPSQPRHVQNQGMFRSTRQWYIDVDNSQGTTANSREFREAFDCPVKAPTCELW